MPLETRNPRNMFAATLIAALFVAMTAGIAQAQPPEPPAPPQAEQPSTPQPPQGPPEIQAVPDINPRIRIQRDQRGILRVSQDYLLNDTDRVENVVVIWGDANLRGRVDRDVVVVMGTATIAETASIGGDLVIIGGQGSIARGASVGGDLVAVGAPLEVPPDFTPGGEYAVIDPPIMGSRLNAFFPWITRGLIWGRFIVPSLPWIWVFVAGFFVFYAVLNALVDPPIRATTTVLLHKPLTAFGAGLLVLLLFGPVSALLAVSVIGIPIIPFLACAFLLAALLGRVACMRWMGMRLSGDADAGTPATALRAFTIGFVVLTIIYMVPVFAIVTWASIGVLGLGAATLAFADHYRRERPSRAPTSGPGGGDPRYAPPHLNVGPSAGAGVAYESASGGAVVAPSGGAAVAPSEGPAIPDDMPLHGSAFASSGMAGGAAAASASSVQGPPGGPMSSPTNGTTFPLAEFRDRLAASVLDLILIAVVVQVLEPRDAARSMFLGWVAYNIAFWAWKHTTVGGIICQLRVVRANGQPFTIADAIVRGLSSIFSAVVVGLGYLWILRDPDRQAWHDKIAGTYVVKVPKNYPL